MVWMFGFDTTHWCFFQSGFLGNAVWQSCNMSPLNQKAFCFLFISDRTLLCGWESESDGVNGDRNRQEKKNPSRWRGGWRAGSLTACSLEFILRKSGLPLTVVSSSRPLLTRTEELQMINSHPWCSSSFGMFAVSYIIWQYCNMIDTGCNC